MYEQSKFTKSQQQLCFGTRKGREDNLVYYINEGYNLEDKDKTYFDKYNIRELLESMVAKNSL